MGKSYRRPYACIFGSSESAKEDKRIAARNARHLQNHHLKNCTDYEDLLIPHRREASYNDTWSWPRDGGKKLQRPPDLRGMFDSYWARHPERFNDWYEKQVRWYKRICRK